MGGRAQGASEARSRQCRADGTKNERQAYGLMVPVVNTLSATHHCTWFLVGQRAGEAKHEGAGAPSMLEAAIAAEATAITVIAAAADDAAAPVAPVPMTRVAGTGPTYTGGPPPSPPSARPAACGEDGCAPDGLEGHPQ